MNVEMRVDDLVRDAVESVSAPDVEETGTGDFVDVLLHCELGV